MGEVEQEPIKTFFIGEDAFDLPESKVDGFLKKYPDAQERKSFIVEKDTFDIPLAKVDGFLSKYPTAKSTFEQPSIPVVNLSNQKKLSGKNLDIISTVSANTFANNPIFKDEKNRETYYSTLYNKGYTFDDVNVIKSNIDKAAGTAPISVSIKEEPFKNPQGIEITTSPLSNSSSIIPEVGGKKNHNIMVGTMDLFASDDKYLNADVREAYYSELQQQGVNITPTFKNNVEGVTAKKEIIEGKSLFGQIINPIGAPARVAVDMGKSGVETLIKGGEMWEEGASLPEVLPVGIKGLGELALAGLSATTGGIGFVNAIEVAHRASPKVVDKLMAPVTAIRESLGMPEPETETGKALLWMADFAAFGWFLSEGHNAAKWSTAEGKAFVKGKLDPEGKANTDMKIKALTEKFGRLTPEQKENAANLWADMQMNELNKQDIIPKSRPLNVRQSDYLEKIPRGTFTPAEEVKNVVNTTAKTTDVFTPAETTDTFTPTNDAVNGINTTAKSTGVFTAPETTGTFIPSKDVVNTTAQDAVKIIEQATQSSEQTKSNYEVAKKEITGEIQSFPQADLNGKMPDHFPRLLEYVQDFDHTQPLNEVANGLAVKYQGRNGQLRRSETGEITFTDFNNGKSEIVTGGGNTTPFNESGFSLNEGYYKDKHGEYFVQGDNVGYTVYEIKDGKLKPVYEGEKSNQARKEAIIKKALNKTDTEILHDQAQDKAVKLQVTIEKAKLEGNQVVVDVLMPKLEQAINEAAEFEGKNIEQQAKDAEAGAIKANAEKEIANLSKALEDAPPEVKVEIEQAIIEREKITKQEEGSVPDPAELDRRNPEIRDVQESIAKEIKDNFDANEIKEFRDNMSVEKMEKILQKLIANKIIKIDC